MFIGRISFACAGSKCTSYKQGNTTGVISGAWRGIPVFKRYRKWDSRHRSQAFWPQCPGEVQSRTPARWGMLEASCCSAPAPPSCTGDFTSTPRRGTDPEQPKEPQVLFGLYRMIVPWGCISRWDQTGVSVVSFKEEKLCKYF